MLEQYSDRYDPRVAARILKGREATAADIRELHEQRAAMIDVIDRATRDWDMLAMPTVPIVAPLLSAIESDADYTRLNVLVLRNPSLVNFLDRCAISLPIHDHAEAPVGLMLVGTRNGDSRLLRIAHAIEHALPQLSRTRP
jgi:aspartyl-tRNA(Asn)/glutamyl-tRNA(Gln) amidotransferase subunit A